MVVVLVYLRYLNRCDIVITHCVRISHWRHAIGRTSALVAEVGGHLTLASGA